MVNEVVGVVGTADRYRTQGLGVWAKNPKTSGGCSVSDAPVETDGGADGGGNLGVGNEVVESVGRADQHRTRGLGVWAKKNKTERVAWFQVRGWKRTMGTIEGVSGVWEIRWWWWLGQPFDDTRGWGCLGPKIKTEPIWARLRVRY